MQFFKSSEDRSSLNLGGEIAELKETFQSRINRLESALKQEEASTSSTTQRAEEIEKSLRAEVATLKGRLKEKEKQLDTRNTELKDLQSKTDVLVNRAAEMESSMESRDPAFSEAHRAGPEKIEPAPIQSAPDTLPRQFFDHLISELTEAMGPMASLVVRDQVAALGESMEGFAKIRLNEFLNAVSQEFLDEKRRREFQQRMAETAEMAENDPEPQAAPKTPLRKTNGLDVEENGLEAELVTKIQDMKNQLREQEKLLKLRDAEVRRFKLKMSSNTNGGENVVIDELKSKLVENDSLLDAKEEEIEKVREQMAAENEKLRSELQAKKVLLAKIERDEWKAMGSSKMWKGWTGS